MRIFVVGGTGAVGRPLVPVLLDAGHEAVVATRSDSGRRWATSVGADTAVVDVFDGEALAQEMRRARPDVIIDHLTDLAGGSAENNARLRIEGTQHLVRAAESAGCARIVAQSISWAYEGGVGPATEDTPLDDRAVPPRSTTVHGIAALEHAVSWMDQAVVLRLGTLYGPRTWYSPQGDVVERMRRGEFETTDGVTSFLHVEDAARATLAALEWPSGPVNIVDDRPARASEWAPVLAAHMGAPTPVVTGPGEPWQRGADNTHAREQLTWVPAQPDWRQGFHAMSTDPSR